MQIILACRSTASCRLWTYDCDMTTDALFAWLGVRLSAFLWFLLRIPAEETCTEDPFVVVVAAVCGTSSLASVFRLQKRAIHFLCQHGERFLRRTLNAGLPVPSAEDEFHPAKKHICCNNVSGQYLLSCAVGEVCTAAFQGMVELYATT